MADNDPTTPGAHPPDTTPAPVADTSENATSKALAAAAVLAEQQKVDEGDEGGHYVVNGQDVNADGKPIKKNAKGKWEVVKDGQ